MKILVTVILMITASIAVASNHDQRCTEEGQTTNEPIIREVR